MDIIPVIDLIGGTVVRARMGQRDQYRPIITPLSPTSDPVDVTRGLLSVHPFAAVYVADLDAIERRGDNRATLRRLQAQFPGVSFWVDNGAADRAAVAGWLAGGVDHIVLGSESQADAAAVRAFADDPRVVLSLDFAGESFRGPPALLDDTDAWPSRIIVMTLVRVGSGTGPDLKRVSAVRDGAAGRKVYAAGGVRGAADLVTLRRAGIAGALVASCLHDGSLDAAAIAHVLNEPAPAQTRT
jgi:phosphoribosylformimino-5-aminoimidazole carboxamide ribotide isomerase